MGNFPPGRPNGAHREKTAGRRCRTRLRAWGFYIDGAALWDIHMRFLLHRHASRRKKSCGVATRRTRRKRWKLVAAGSRRLLPAACFGIPVCVSPINVIRMDFPTSPDVARAGAPITHP